LAALVSPMAAARAGGTIDDGIFTAAGFIGRRKVGYDAVYDPAVGRPLRVRVGPVKVRLLGGGPIRLPRGGSLWHATDGASSGDCFRRRFRRACELDRPDRELIIVLAKYRLGGRLALL